VLECSLEPREDAAVSPALFLRTFKLMADNMTTSVPGLLVTEEMAVNSQFPATPCGKSRNSPRNLVHLGLRAGQFGSSPTVAGEIPNRGAAARDRAVRSRERRLRGCVSPGS